jgi:uncharacterized repeat protein (TIGR01451 family)
VDKRPEESTVGPFGVAQYNLKLSNKTTAPVTGLIITDTLPTGFEFISVLPDNPAPYSTEPLVWRDLEIAPTKYIVIEYKVRAASLLGTYINWIDGVSDATNVIHDTRYYTDRVKLDVVPGVGLYKLVDTERAEAGSTVVYTLTIDNRSEIDIANITITDTLPPSFSYQGMLSGNDPISTPTGLVWTIGHLENLDKVELVFSARVDDEIFNGNYCNQASATAFKADDPSEEVLVPDTDLAACVKVAGLPTIERSKTVSPLEVQAGSLVTYTISLYNDTGESQTLRLTDTLPAGLTYFGVMGATPAPVLTSPVVWQGLSLGVDQDLTLVFQARVDPLADSGAYYNRLDTRTAEFVLPPAADLAPVQVAELPRYDLQTHVSDGVLRVQEGDVLNYTIVYTNDNDADLTLSGVVITDTFYPPPPDATPLNWVADWEAVETNVYRHTVGDLAPGDHGQVQFSLQLSGTIPEFTEVISNQVEIFGYVQGEADAFDDNPDNDQHADLDILRGVDLVVTNVDISPAQPTAGEDVSFAVTVRSQGTLSPVNRVDDRAWFYVELYLKDSDFSPAGPPGAVYPPAALDHRGGYWCLTYPACPSMRDEYLFIAPGLGKEDNQDVYPFTVNLPAGVYDVYVQVDPTFSGASPWGQADGLIKEVFEDNNVYTHKTQLTVVSGGSLVYLPVILRGN